MIFNKQLRLLLFAAGMFSSTSQLYSPIPSDEEIRALAAASVATALEEWTVEQVSHSDVIPTLRKIYEGVSLGYFKKEGIGSAQNMGLAKFFVAPLENSSLICMEDGVAQVEASTRVLYIDPDFITSILPALYSEITTQLAEQDPSFYMIDSADEARFPALESASLLKNVVLCFIKTLLFQWNAEGVPFRADNLFKQGVLVEFLFTYLKAYYFPIRCWCEENSTITTPTMDLLDATNKEVVESSINGTLASFLGLEARVVPDGEVVTLPVTGS